MNVGFRDTGDRFDSDSDTFGAPVKAVVIAKYPFLVLLSNGMSATYTQLAMYYRRNGRRRCIC